LSLTSPEICHPLTRYFAFLSLRRKEIHSWIAIITLNMVHKLYNSGKMARLGEENQHPKPPVVVTVSWVIPITVSRTHPIRFVVPRAAAQHTLTLDGKFPTVNTV